MTASTPSSRNRTRRVTGDWWGITVGPGEDPSIHLTRVYVRLSRTNSDRGPGRWFKWQPRGVQPHRVEITDSVFAVDRAPQSWKLPEAMTWHGTNFILWLGDGIYPGPRPAGVAVLEGAAARAKWSAVRNQWLTAHGFQPLPADDLDPMDDRVTSPTG